MLLPDLPLPDPLPPDLPDLLEEEPEGSGSSSSSLGVRGCAMSSSTPSSVSSFSFSTEVLEDPMLLPDTLPDPLDLPDCQLPEPLSPDLLDLLDLPEDELEGSSLSSSSLGVGR